VRGAPDEPARPRRCAVRRRNRSCPTLWNDRHALGSLSSQTRRRFGDRLKTWGGGRRPESTGAAEKDVSETGMSIAGSSGPGISKCDVSGCDVSGTVPPGTLASSRGDGRSGHLGRRPPTEQPARSRSGRKGARGRAAWRRRLGSGGSRSEAREPRLPATRLHERLPRATATSRT
jgi:hypothetical protein